MFSIPEFLSDEHSLGVFLLVTVADGRRRRLARRPRDRGDLAAVVASLRSICWC